MGHVAGQGCHVTHLWSANDTTAFHQASAVTDDVLIVHDLCVRHSTANGDVLVVHGDAVESGDTRRVYHGFHRRAHSLLDFQQQVGAAADYLGAPVVVIEPLNRFLDGVRHMVVVPANSDKWLLV